MKTLFKFLASTILCAVTATGLCFTSVAGAADGNKPTTDKERVVDHLMMKDGKMMVMKGADSMAMKEEMMLTNGSKVMMDGTVVTKGGDKMMMKDDDMITMDGKMMKGGAKKHDVDKKKE